MLTKAEFKTLLVAVGQSVEVHQAKPPRATTKANAVVQSTSKAEESIVNAYGLNGMSFQFSSDDVTPSKMDQVVLSTGERFTINDVVKHHERVSGALSSYTVYCKGK